VLVGSLISWSLCTIAGSFSQNFGALAASRAGVAIGEAGATPQALSIIDRMFPERGRAMAIAIFSCGSPVGTLIGLSVGGWLATHGSWRTAMFWAGVPGLAIAILLLATASIPKAPRKPPPTHSMFASIGVLLKIPAYRWIVIGLTSMAYASWASITFQPSVLVRSFGLSLAEIGLALGLIQGLIAGLAMLAGGYAGDSLGRRDARWRPRIGMLAMLVSAPFFVAAQFAPSGHAALVLLIIPASCWTLFLPPLYSAVHSIVPPDMKATGIAVLFFFLSVVGSALGPIGTGIASDLLQPLLGENSLRAALASSSVMLLFAAACFFRASQHAAPAPAP
jgi:predicted MFS family arabinose efflux permease